MLTESTQRAAVIAEALTWRGTPFHDNAWIKGAGVDCAHLVHQVYHAAGVIPDLGIQPYSPQHFLHRDEELFMSYVLRTGAREISPERLQPADLVLYKIGRVYAHGAIVIDWPRQIVHAFKQARCVLISKPFEGLLRTAPFKAFSFWGR